MLLVVAFRCFVVWVDFLSFVNNNMWIATYCVCHKDDKLIV